MDCGVLDAIDDPDLIHPAAELPKAPGDFNAVAAVAWIAPVAASASTLRLSLAETLLPFHGPPSNVLFCVYLN
jgi:hypothetical protein